VQAAFIGGGYDTEANNATGNAFFVLDLATGQKLWEYTRDGVTGDHQFMNFSVAASPTAIDLDNDQLIDRVYLGDVGGQLWRFDVGPGVTWAGRRLWAADAAQANPPAAGEYYPAQAIYAAPSVTLDPSGNLWLFFGTGDRNHPNHASANFFYGILDKDTTVETGWTLTLGSDEKVLSTADVFNHVVFFSTFTPTSTVSCETSGGTAKLYAVHIDTGYAALNFATGELLASSSSSTTPYHAAGSGIPSKPIVVLDTSSGPTATPMVIVGTTSQELASTSAPALSLRQILSWRDVY
jgi:type IV pilus assembly protein PilY1